MIRQQGFVTQVFVKLDEFQSLICICIFFFYLYLKLFHVSPCDETIIALVTHFLITTIVRTVKLLYFTKETASRDKFKNIVHGDFTISISPVILLGE